MFTTMKRNTPKIFHFRLLPIALFLGLIFLSCASASGVVWYVSGDIDISGNGTTWPEAFLTIQEAVNAAGEGDEIWLKKGTYSLSAQINIDKAAAIYGGFAGSETQRDQRDVATNVTSIDGQGSVYHCFYITADATIDGLTITGGNANGVSPDHTGGGIYIYQSFPRITNCIISENTAEYGGGVYNLYSSPTITGCTFTKNSTIKSGGGIYNNYDSSPAITDCNFSENSASFSGGGILNSNNSSPTITNCAFTENSAVWGGGIFNDNSSPIITNCTFSGNSATVSGGGMYIDTSSPTITNCNFSENSAEWGGGIYNEESSPTITTCTFTENSATRSGGAINNNNSSPEMTECLISKQFRAG